MSAQKCPSFIWSIKSLDFLYIFLGRSIFEYGPFNFCSLLLASAAPFSYRVLYADDTLCLLSLFFFVMLSGCFLSALNFLNVLQLTAQVTVITCYGVLGLYKQNFEAIVPCWINAERKPVSQSDISFFWGGGFCFLLLSPVILIKSLFVSFETFTKPLQNCSKCCV